MCGRFSLTATPEEVAEFLDLEEVAAFPPRYNIAPTQPVLMAFEGPGGKRQSSLVRWGLVPSWVKDPLDFTLLINARSETAATKPSFRNAMRHRRALLPASGFYEWHRPADRKAHRQAYWIRPRQGGIVCFAGLVETWSDASGSEVDTGCILTVGANAAIAPIHDRMPVVIAPQDFGRWLDCRTQEPRDVEDLLRPAAEDFFEAIAVSDKVNKVANMGPDIQEPCAPGENRATDGGRSDRARASASGKPAAGSGKDGQFDLF